MHLPGVGKMLLGLYEKEVTVGNQRPNATASAAVKRRARIERLREARMGRAELEQTKARLDEIERVLEKGGFKCDSRDSQK